MKNIRSYIKICWLIGCKEGFSDSGYSVCFCGKHSYYDYDDYSSGLIQIVRNYPEKTVSFLKEKIESWLYPYVRFCSYCHKVDYWFGKNLYEKHDECLPF